jgi:hypothetical protein
MVLGNINRLCAGFIWRFGERKPVRKKGLIRRRWALRERRLVNWRPRSNMRRGAKSKHLERLSLRSRPLLALPKDAGVANWHKQSTADKSDAMRALWI